MSTIALQGRQSPDWRRRMFRAMPNTCGVLWAVAAVCLSQVTHAQQPLPVAGTAATAGAVQMSEDSAGTRVFTFASAVTVMGAAGCTTAITMRIVAPPNVKATRIGELPLAEQAVKSGRRLVLTNGRCVGNGIVEAEAVALEPDAPSAPSPRSPLVR